MIEAPHQVSHENDEHLLHDEERKPAGSSVAIRVICFILAIAAIGLGWEVLQQKKDLASSAAQLTQAQSETDQAKADLAKANSQSSDQKAQLDKANSLRADLQTQLDRAQTRQSALQSQLEKTRTELQAQVDKAKAQAADMQGEIARANDASTQTRRELDRVRAQADDLKSQLASSQAEVARLQPVVTKARILPIAATFEKGFFSRKFTMSVKNTGSEALKVTVASAGNDKAPLQAATIEAGGTLKVEDVAAGASLVIQSEGYDPLSVTAK